MAARCTGGATHCEWCHRDVPSLSEHRGACQALYTDAVLREQIYPCPKLKKTGLKTP
jgi:hypothetical protein